MSTSKTSPDSASLDAKFNLFRIVAAGQLDDSDLPQRIRNSLAFHGWSEGEIKAAIKILPKVAIKKEADGFVSIKIPKSAREVFIGDIIKRSS